MKHHYYYPTFRPILFLPLLLILFIHPQFARAQQPNPGNNSPICIGNTLNLTSNFISNATYMWLGPNGFSSNLQNPVILQAGTANAGQYTLSVTVNSQTTTAFTNAQILQTLSPQAGSNSPICLGGTLNLSANNIAGVSYSWSGPGGFASGLRTPSIPNVQSFNAGVYTVTLSKIGCQTTTGTTSVSVSTSSLNVQAGSNSPVCSGNTLQLSATSINGATYLWSGPSGFSANISNPSLPNAQPPASGNYTVSVSANGCTTHQIVQVNVLMAPIANPSANTPVCQGQSIFLSAQPVQNGTYAWSGPGGFSSQLQNPVIQNAQSIHSGVYTLTVLAGNCPSATQTIQVTVNPAPQAFAGSNSPVCAGNTLSLTATSIQGATYFWSGPNGFTSNQQNPTINPAGQIHSGGYQLVISNTGCGNLNLFTQVQVNGPAQFTAGNNGPICSGNTLLLTTTLQSTVPVLWLGPNGYSSNILNPSIQNAQTIHSGTYTLSVNVPGCGTYSSTTTAVVNIGNTTNVTAGANTPLCSGQTLFLTTTTVTGATYAWTGPGGFTSNQQNPSRFQVTPNHSGIYNVSITTQGCGSITRSVQVQVNNGPLAQPGSNSPVCVGATLNLTTPNLMGQNYLWLGPNGFSSTAPTPFIQNAQTIHSGVYTLQVSTQGCGTSSATTSVSVLPGFNNTQVTISSNSPLCTGTTLNLSITSIPGANYFWTGPNGFTSNQQNPSRSNVTLQMAGNYAVSISGNGCGTISRNIQVVVNQAPIAQASANSPICTGQTLNLNTPLMTGATYIWTGPAGYSANINNPTRPNVQSNMAGIYTVVVSTPGCGSTASTINVVVNPGFNSISAGSNSPICSGQTLNLSVTNITGATYQWTGPNAFTSALRTPAIQNAGPPASGTYVVVVTVPGCGSITKQVSVQVNPAPMAQASSNSPICAGMTLQLSTPMSGNSTYLWTGPAGFSSNLRTPQRLNATTNMAGIYTVIVSTPGCGTASSTTSVVVNPTSTNVTAGSNSPICIGQNLNLSVNTISGGTYAWAGPGGFSSSSQNPVRTNATPQMSGVYTVTVTGSPCGPITLFVSVVVNSPMNLTAGSNSPVCAGSSLNLTSGPVTNTTQGFTWTGPVGFSANGANVSRNPAQTTHSGIYTVRVNVPGCGMQQATVNVTVNGFPSVIQASANSPLCVGSTLVLTGTPVTGSTTLWTGPGGYSANGSQVSRIQATPAMNGTYQYTVTLPGCGIRQAFASVVVNNPATVTAVASPNPVCAGGNIVLSANGPGGTSYLWNGPGGYSSNQRTAIRSGANNTMAGIYSLQANVPGCGPVNRTVSVTIINCRVASGSDTNESEIDLSVSPNPFSGNLLVTSRAGMLQNLSLMDLNGRMLLNQTLEPSGNNTIITEGLPSGIYVLVVTTFSGEQLMTRVIKE
jgi:hypothetical protein